MFQVSVITPVYNAATTVRRAVESAVSLDEVGEIILIDDAGPDDALTVCRALEHEHAKVRLLRHPDHGNHGAGASRNLGIAEARFPFIAFLDADDYYLPNRFERDRDILTADPSIDGVYGATGITYEDEAARERFHAAGYAYQEFTTISAPVPPEELFAVLFHQHPAARGEFMTDAITVRRSLLDRVGGFHPELRLQQDTHLWKRLAAAGRLAPGFLDEPVAIRGVHARNRMTDAKEQEKYRDLWWESLARDLKRLRCGCEIRLVFEKAHASYLAHTGQRARAVVSLARIAARDPGLLAEEYGYFDLNYLAVVGSMRVAHQILSLKNRFVRARRQRRTPGRSMSAR